MTHKLTLQKCPTYSYYEAYELNGRPAICKDMVKLLLVDKPLPDELFISISDKPRKNWIEMEFTRWQGTKNVYVDYIKWCKREWDVVQVKAGTYRAVADFLLNNFTWNSDLKTFWILCKHS